MSKQLLQEITLLDFDKNLLIESIKNNSVFKIKCKLQEADVKNGNNRVYPRNILEREIEGFRPKMKERTSLGELDHPDRDIVNLANASHLITEIWWDGNKVMGEIEILSTPSGNIAKELLKCGVKLGISSRAMGSVKQIGENVEVQPDLELITWDLVSNPSTPNAYLEQISLRESLGLKNKKDYTNINSLITEILCSRGYCSCELKK